MLALRETSGEFVSNPPPEHPIDAGQVLIAIGTPAELGRLTELAAG